LNRDDASQLSNTSLFVSRSVFEPLEDGTFYVADLIGLSVHSEKGQFFGTVCAVHDFGSGPVLEIQMSGSPLQQKRESGEECTSRSEDSPKNKSALRKTFYLPFDNNVHLQEAPERNLVVSEALYAVFTT
jgi:ribosomal 30S subunit maturation factor RimM